MCNLDHNNCDNFKEEPQVEYFKPGFNLFGAICHKYKENFWQRSTDQKIQTIVCVHWSSNEGMVCGILLQMFQFRNNGE